MTNLSSETRRVLEAYGWQEDRHVDTSEYERVLLAAGYEDCKAACDFLQRYGDLEVNMGLDENWLDTRLNCLQEIMQKVPVSFFSDIVGKTLYFIGLCQFDFMVLLMDSSGRVYRFLEMVKPDVFGIDLFLIAASGEEAIEKIVQEFLTEANIKGEWIANSWGPDYLAGGIRAERTLKNDDRVSPKSS